MSNISASIVTILYNNQLMKLEGEDGIAAYGVVMYVGFIFIAMFIGYAVGTAPIIGYNYGAQNYGELKNLLKKSTVICFISGGTMTLFAFIFASPLSSIFVGYDQRLLELTANGFKIFSLSFVLSGFCIFGSSFFTALNNGLVSAVLSFMRTLVYQMVGILLLPIFFGIDGVWSSMLLAEFLALTTTVFFLILNRKKYKYM